MVRMNIFMLQASYVIWIPFVQIEIIFPVADPGGARRPGPPGPKVEHTFCAVWHNSL